MYDMEITVELSHLFKIRSRDQPIIYYIRDHATIIIKPLDQYTDIGLPDDRKIPDMSYILRCLFITLGNKP